jgi:hypothetical protein
MHIDKIIFNICSWFSTQTDETRPSLSRYYKWFARLKRIKDVSGQNTLFYTDKILKDG